MSETHALVPPEVAAELAWLREEIGHLRPERDALRDELTRLREVLEELAHLTMDARELAYLSDMQQEDIQTARNALKEPNAGLAEIERIRQIRRETR